MASASCACAAAPVGEDSGNEQCLMGVRVAEDAFAADAVDGDATKSFACFAFETVKIAPTATLLKQTLTSNPAPAHIITNKYCKNIAHVPPSRWPSRSRPLNNPILVQSALAVSIVNGALAAHMSSHSCSSSAAMLATAAGRSMHCSCVSTRPHTVSTHPRKTSTISSYGTTASGSRLNMGATAACSLCSCPLTEPINKQPGDSLLQVPHHQIKTTI
jgi:hypothetical protein